MFNKDVQENSIKNAETIIGPSIKVKGNFHGDGNIVVEGIVEGNIKTKKFFLQGAQSLIDANIEAKDSKISGQVNGNLNIENYLEITNSAKIKGDIKANIISIEKGAIINGHIQMGKVEPTHNGGKE